MTRPICQVCKVRVATEKGASFKKPSPHKSATCRGVVFVCSTCPKPRTIGGVRARYHRLETEFLEGFPPLTVNKAAVENA